MKGCPLLLSKYLSSCGGGKSWRSKNCAFWKSFLSAQAISSSTVWIFSNICYLRVFFRAALMIAISLEVRNPAQDGSVCTWMILEMTITWKWHSFSWPQYLKVYLSLIRHINTYTPFSPIDDYLLLCLGWILAQGLKGLSSCCWTRAKEFSCFSMLILLRVPFCLTNTLKCDGDSHNHFLAQCWNIFRNMIALFWY